MIEKWKALLFSHMDPMGIRIGNASIGMATYLR